MEGARRTDAAAQAERMRLAETVEDLKQRLAAEVSGAHGTAERLDAAQRELEVARTDLAAARVNLDKAEGR